MSSMETINAEGLPTPEIPADPAQKQAKLVFIGFAVTITVGLALAGWYLGGRIFAAEKVHAAVIAKPVVAAPVEVKSVEAATVAEPIAEAVAEPIAEPAAEPLPVADPVWDTVDPQPRELYLQLATMGPNSTKDYLKTLDAKGIHPRIAPGPSENLHRVLLGPYPDRAACEKEQHELEVAGVQFIARRY